VTPLCLVSPAGFPARHFAERPTRSYGDAGDDERLFREICRHNLLINMLSDPASVTEISIGSRTPATGRRTRTRPRSIA
jgi:hypothetical protein